MSIINDALKRAQKNLEKIGKAPEQKEEPKVAELTKDVRPRSHPLPPIQPDKKGNTHKKKKMWYQTVSVLVVLFFLVIGIFGATLFFLMKRSASGETEGDKVRRNYMPKKMTQTYKPGELVLSGTSLIENKRVALINGDIYEPGDIVEGYRIISVDLSKVELQSLKGETLILRVSSPSDK